MDMTLIYIGAALIGASIGAIVGIIAAKGYLAFRDVEDEY